MKNTLEFEPQLDGHTVIQRDIHGEEIRRFDSDEECRRAQKGMPDLTIGEEFRGLVHEGITKVIEVAHNISGRSHRAA